MKKNNRRVISRLASVLLLLLSVFFVTVFAQKSTAATSNQTIYSGAHYTMQVGDTLYLTNPAPTSYEAVFRAYGWDGGSGIVSISNSTSKTATVTALQSGSVTISASYQEEIPYQNPYPFYNIATNKWETHYETRYRTNQYDYQIYIDVADNAVPTVTAQPCNAAAASGKTVSTSVSASDASKLQYQWYIKNPGQSSFTKSSVTSATYSCKMTSKISGRQVYCVITDEYGNSTRSDTAYLSLLGITKQPSNVYVKNGAKASTSIKAEGKGLKYQWYIKDPGKTSFTKSSIKTAKYSYTMSKAKSGRQVYCVITNQYGNSVKTKTVTLKIIETAKITKQPVKDFAASGKTVSVTVTAKGDGLKYQWYVKNPGSSTYQKSSITGPTYKITMNSSRSGRMVYCVVSDRYGNKVKSKAVSLAMFAITKQPTSQTGTKVSTTVKAQGNGLKYQWYVKNPGSSAFSKSSITGATYKTTMNRARHGRQIYCKITDKYGNSIKTNVCTLSMMAITQQPKNITTTQKAQTTVKAIGEGLTYQWYVKDPGMSSFKKSSITSATYAVKMSTAKSGRRVYCVVKDQYGNSARSKTATLYYFGIMEQPGPVICGSEFEKVAATITAVGKNLSYQWYFSHDGISFKEAYGECSNQYTRYVFEGDWGRESVYCKVTDEYGNSATSDVSVMTYFEIKSLTKNITVKSNQTSQVHIGVFGNDPMTYEWHPYLAGCPDTPVLSTKYIFTVDAAFAQEYPVIYCIITDRYGDKFVSDLVTLEYIP